MNGPMCPFLCKEGECTGMCMPGTKQCTDNVPQTCDADGNWMDAGAACPSVCSDGVCTGTCTPGDKQCNRNVVQACDPSGAWASGQTCMYVCADGECTGECMPNAKRCDDTTPQKCSAQGQWEQNGAPCTNVCADGACTGECMPGSQRCSGTTPQRCNDKGTWERMGSACPNVCLDGMCTGECKPNAVRCSSAGTPEKCDERGRWNSNGTQCPYECTNGVCTGECNPSGSAPHCVPGTNKEQTCVNHRWTGGIISKACGAECITEADVSPKCNGTKHRTCEGGKIVETVTEGACGVLCSPGEGGCELVRNGVYSTCSGVTCEKSMSSIDDTMATFVCTADGTKMYSTYCGYQFCDDAQTIVAFDVCKGTASGAARCTRGSCP